MQPQEIDRTLNSLALTRLTREGQVAKLRELAEGAYKLAEIMHILEARQTLAGVAGDYAEIADTLERAGYRVSHWH